MRKIWSKIRKIFINIGLALFTFGTKVMALNPKTDILYGIPEPGPLYGVEPVKPEQTFFEKALPILKTVFLPLIFVIGLIVYWKKSKAEKKDKIYVIVEILILGVIIYGIITCIKNAGL